MCWDPQAFLSDGIKEEDSIQVVMILREYRSYTRHKTKIKQHCRKTVSNLSKQVTSLDAPL